MASFFASRPVTFKYDDVPDLTGQVAIITGASTGIGKATLSALAQKGAHVVCIGRNPDKTKAAIAEVVRLTGNEKVDYIEADFNDLKSVDKAAMTFLEKGLPIHMLILNAGIMALPQFELSRDGIEKHFATNHFAHFLLTARLLPTIERTALSAQPVRVVAVSSGGNTWAPKEGVNFDKVNDEKFYKGMRRYGETKLANIVTVKELQRRLDEKHGKDVKIYCNSLHPGAVHTEVGRYAFPPLLAGTLTAISKMCLLTPEQGAMTSVYLATSPDVASNNIRGEFYWDQARKSRPSEVHAKAEDEVFRRMVWEWTESVLNEKLAVKSMLQATIKSREATSQEVHSMVDDADFRKELWEGE